MTETTVWAIWVERVGVNKLAKKAGLADRSVTAVISGRSVVSGEDLLKLHRAAEALLQPTIRSTTCSISAAITPLPPSTELPGRINSGCCVQRLLPQRCPNAIS
jgi:hypothetical protein